jgi:hypothetical protein
MSDQGPTAAPVAAPAAAVVEAPAAAPEAEQPSPLKKESFREAFERHQAKVEGGEKPETPKTEPVAAKPSKKVATKDPDLEQFNALAKKLGMKVESGKVLPSDRAKFREWEKKRTESLTTTERERLSAVEKREKEVETQIKQAQSILKAKADGDYQGLAKELGFEDWDKLQEDVIARISDPNYKRLRELEQESLTRKEQEQKAKEEADKRAEQQKQATARQRLYEKFSDEMTKEEDPLIAAMGNHPLFVNAVLNVQQQLWQKHGALSYKTLSNEKAQGAARTIREECKDLYDRLHKAFGGQQQAAPAKVRPMPGKSAPVAPSRGTEASGGKVMTREERNAYERRRLAEAIERDRKAAEG